MLSVVKLPHEPHLFLADEDDVSCAVCTLPEGNARHTGETCPDCGHLANEHRRERRGRYCSTCKSRCKA